MKNREQESQTSINFAVSSWSLDGLLQSGLPLLELPQHLKAHDISLLELCHFHLPSTDDNYLQSFKQALQQADVKLSSLLIDTGDIAAPDDAKRNSDMQEIKNWVDVAATLGAERVRIVAGNQEPTPEVIARSSQHLGELVAYAKTKNVKVSTENWQKTSLDAEVLLELLSNNPELGLCADIGNAEQTKNKYKTLEKLLPHATSVHFKARYENGQIEPNDLQTCMNLINEVKFSGVVTMIYEGKQNEWEGIGQLKNAVASGLEPPVVNL
jgi:sugar phosphate isomerase/epimerase